MDNAIGEETLSLQEAACALQEAIHASQPSSCMCENEEEWAKKLGLEEVSREEAQKRLLQEASVEAIRSLVRSASGTATKGILRAVVEAAVQQIGAPAKEEAVHGFVDTAFEKLAKDGLRVRVEEVFGVVLCLLCLVPMAAAVAPVAPVTSAEHQTEDSSLPFCIFAYEFLQSVWNVRRSSLCEAVRGLLEVESALRGGEEDVQEVVTGTFEMAKEDVSKKEFVGLMMALFNSDAAVVHRFLSSVFKAK